MKDIIRIFNEYAEEEGKIVDINKLKADFLEKETYKQAHRGLVIACHDVFINYKGKMLLVCRDNFPAKNDLWPIGGRILRGISIEDSLRQKVRKECGLFLRKIKFLGADRNFFRTSPYDGEETDNKGTDSLSVAYYAEGYGKIKLDELHKKYTLLTIEDYLEIKPKLHSYIKKYLDFLCSCENHHINSKNLSSMKWGENL